jgi:hypothetical protein
MARKPKILPPGQYNVRVAAFRKVRNKPVYRMTMTTHDGTVIALHLPAPASPVRRLE